MNPNTWANVKQVFERKYSNWELALPAEPPQSTRGIINKQGWTINFRYVTEQAEHYLEYFASHRMTNDTLNRIYADGREEISGHCQEFYAVGDAEAERAYHEHNQQFYAYVKERGLL